MILKKKTPERCLISNSYRGKQLVTREGQFDTKWYKENKTTSKSSLIVFFIQLLVSPRELEKYTRKTARETNTCKCHRRTRL